MRYFYAFSLLFILASCQKDEKKVIEHDKTDWAFYKLNGNVKSITTKSWQVNEKLEKVKTLHEDNGMRNSDMAFDENGKLTSEEQYIRDGAPIETKKFNGRENLLEFIQYMNEKPFIKTSYEWDASGKNNTAIIKRNGDNSELEHLKREFHNGRLAKTTILSPQNIPTETTAYIYDSKGNIIEQDIYLTGNTIQYKNIYKYDRKNRQVSEANYNADGKKNFETVSDYDGKNLVKKHTVNNKGEAEFSEEYTYDAKGNVATKLTNRKYDNSKTLDRFNYDDKGNKIIWQIINNDKPFMSAQYTYDQYNNITSVISTDAANKIIDDRQYNYEYDKKGNWIKKKSQINNAPGFVVERTITYFGN